MTDRITIVCSKCRKPFGERAPRLRNGYQVQCPHCMKLITFDSSSEDPNIRRPLKAARDFRIAAEEARRVGLPQTISCMSVSIRAKAPCF